MVTLRNSMSSDFRPKRNQVGRAKGLRKPLPPAGGAALPLPGAPLTPALALRVSPSLSPSTSLSQSPSLHLRWGQALAATMPIVLPGGWPGRCRAQEPSCGTRLWGVIKQGAQLLRHVSDRSPQAPAQLCSSWPPPMLGLPPPSFPPLTLAVASSGPVKSVMPENTWLPSHSLTKHSGSSASPTLAPAHPGEGEKPRGLRAPSDGAFKEQPPPPPSQPPPHTRCQVYRVGQADRVTGQAAGMAGDDGPAGVERAQGRRESGRPLRCQSSGQ